MELNKYLGAMLLDSNAVKKDVLELCNDALENNYASVCVNPYYVSYAKEILAVSHVNICCVVGFPLGMNRTEVKVLETRLAILDGADEIDMVMNIAALKDQKYDVVKREIQEVLEACQGRVLKVIIETCYLSSEEIKKATSLCDQAHINFIKTSTGYGNKEVTVEDVALICEAKSDLLEIAVGGNIKTLKEVNQFVDLGVTRIDTNDAKKVMEEWK